MKLPASNRPTPNIVVSAAQKTRNQMGASWPASALRADRLAIISVPESTGVRNSMNDITTPTPATSWVIGRYSINV
ncbi:hypothetical protein D3C73_1382910 [compost metagenome]